MILVHETDNPYRNGSYTLGCTEVTSMSTYLEAWNFSLTAGGWLEDCGDREIKEMQDTLSM